MPDPRKKLYEALSANNFDLGSYDEFNTKMDNPVSRKKLYDAAGSNDFDLGSYDDFESKIGGKKKSQDSGSTSVGPKSVSAPKSGSSAGQTSMKTFEGLSDNDLKSLKKGNKPVPEINPLVKNKIKEKNLSKELSKVKVTPENMNQVTAKTDELSALKKESDAIIETDRSNKVKELETSFYDATRDNDDDAIAEQRLNDAVQVKGVWNNVKSIAKNAYNTAVQSIATTQPGAIGLINYKTDTDPLGEEKSQIKKEASKNNEKLTDLQVNERAKELFKTKEKDNLFIDRANSFLDNLPEKDKELLKQDRALKADHLEEDNLKRLKVVSAMRIVAENKISEYKNIESQLTKLKDNNEPFPDELYQKYQSLGSEIKNIGSQLQKNEDYILKNKKDLGTAQQEYDLFKREYGDIKNFVGNVGASALELGTTALAGLDYIGTLGGNIDPKNKNKGVQEDFSKVQKSIDENRDYLRKPVESVESAEGFINYASDLVANQIPNLLATSTGSKGLALIGTASSGKKFTEMNKEVREGKASYTPLEMAVAPLLYGSAEVVSELPTLSILKKGGRVLESVARNEASLLTKTAKQKAKEWSKDFGVDMSKEMAGEQFTNFAQNFNDKYVLGKKDVNLLDNTGQVFKDTFTLTSILKTAPHMFGAVVKPFQSKTDLGKLDENSRKIIEFSKQLNSEDLTETERNVIQKQINSATAESSKIVSNTIGKIDEMPSELYDQVVNLNTKAGEIKAQAREIADGNLSNKEQLIEGLQNEYKAIQEQRNSIIDGRTSTVEVLPLKEQDKLKKQALEVLVTELNPDGKKNMTITNEQILERANEIYSESKSNENVSDINVGDNSKTEGNYPLSTSEPQQTGSEVKDNSPQTELIKPEIKQPITLKELEKENKKTIPKIPSSNVFYNETNYPSEVMREADKNISKKTETIDVRDIVPTQKNLTSSNLSNTKGFDTKNSEEPIEVVEQDGKYYVRDGHHRIANSILNGDSEIEAEVIKIKTNELPTRNDAPANGNIRPGVDGTESQGKDARVQDTINTPTRKGEVTEKLQKINKEVFGLDEKQSKANTVVMEKTLETMAKIQGVSKEEMFDKISFQKGDSETVAELSKKGKALFQIIGKSAKLSSDIKNFLSQAQKLEKQGIEPKEIYLKTGWEKGADGKWKYDMHEGKADFIKQENGKLSEVFDYPQLYEKYPDAKNIDIIFKSNLDGEGMYDEKKNRIFINPSSGPAESRLTILHEIQHWIQNKEGFSKGGSVENARNFIDKKIEGESSSENKSILSKFKNLLAAKKTNPDNIQNSLADLKKIATKSDFDIYESIAGEVEARNVENRLEMRPEDRKNTPISETEDIAKDEQIVLFQGEQGAMLAEDGKFIIYALEDPNVSTPLHELAHVYEHYLSDSERKTVLEDAGQKEWNRETSEHFARGFEKYLADGIAPNPEMKKLFEDFKKWLTDIYKGITNSEIDITLSPEMQKVYDAMLGAKVNEDKSITVGNYTYQFSNGNWIAKDSNGKIDTKKAIPKKVLDTHAENFDFTAGETAYDARKINDVSTWEEDVAKHSNNPVEVAENLLSARTMDASEVLDTMSKHIAETIGGKGVERSSFAQRAGKKGMKDIPGSLALQYFSKKGKGSGLDIIAQNAEIAMYGDWDSQNPRITEDDVFDFINENPRGTSDFLNSIKKEKINALKIAFTDLTGLPANDKYLSMAIEQQQSKDKFINEYMTEKDVLSDEDLLNLQSELDQFNNSTNEETGIKPSGKNESVISDSEESQNRSDIQGESGQNGGGSQDQKSGEIDEFKNEQNRKKDLTSERVSYEKRKQKNTTKKLSSIIKDAANGLKSTMIYSRAKKSNTLGSYNPRNTLIRITKAGDIDTVAHELGHLLDDRFDILGTIPENDKFAILKQLKWYSDRGGSNPPTKATPEQKAEYLEREGLAEFIRSYIANPTQTEILAPELLKHFENTINDKTKEVLNQFSDDYLDFANASAIEKTMANIQEMQLPNKNKFIEWLKGFRQNEDKLSFTKMDKFYAEMANSNHFGIKAFKAILDMTDKSDIKSHENFEIMSRLFLGINGKLENIFSDGMINSKNERLKAEGGVFEKDANGRTIYKDGTPMNVNWLIDGLDKTSEDSLKKEMNDVIAMAVAERTIEYAKKFERTNDLTGIGGSIESDLETAINVLNEFKDLKNTDKAKYDRIKQGVERYRQMADTAMRYAVDKGRLSEEQYQQIKDGNEYYVALNRDMELEPSEDMFSSFNTGTNGIGAAKEIIKKAKGGTSTIENPYLSLLKNINNIVKEADRNEVMKSFVDPLISNRKMGEGEPIDFSKIGYIAKDGDTETIKVFRNGKLEKWKFNEDVYKGLKNIESIASNPIMDFLSKPSKLIRWTVTHNPVFYARNIVKDTQSRLILSKDHSTLKDMFHNAGDKELFELFGGSQAGHLHTDTESYAKTMIKTAKEITKKGGIVLNPKQFGDKYVKFLQSGENVNRIAEFNASYRQAKKQGMSDYDAGLYAAFEARDLMDFAVAGHTMRQINKLIVFSNAGVQSLRKAKKAIQHDPISFIYRTGIYSVLPTVIFAGLRQSMGDDDEYEELPDNQRDMFFNFKTHATGDAWISIPKPYELGLTSAFVDRAISKMRGHQEAFDGVNGTAMKTLMPFDESSFLGGFKPIIETQMNRDTYSDRAIVPEYESGKLLELRKGTKNASLIGQKLSKMFDKAGMSVDPRNIDHIMRGYGTYFANQGMAISDLEKKERAETNFWITKTGFAKDVPTHNSKSVKKTTELAVELGKIRTKSMKNLRNKIEEFSEETDLKKRKIILKDILEYSEKVRKKLEKEKVEMLKKARKETKKAP